MSVIPNKHLQTYGNRLIAGPEFMLIAKNVRIDAQRLTKRRGQDLMMPQDAVGIVGGGTTQYLAYRSKKIIFYNNRVWSYFYDQDMFLQDMIGYATTLDTTAVPWRYSRLGSVGGWADASRRSPQMCQLGRRLALSMSTGIRTSPQLQTDQDLVGTPSADTLQTTMKPAGVPQCLPIKFVSFSDVSLSYGAEGNFLAGSSTGGSRVAYRACWKYIDENGIAFRGAVSDRLVISNDQTVNRAILLEVRIPSQIYSGVWAQRYSLQLYRTQQSVQSIAGFSPDPGDQMYLVNEFRPTRDQITNKVITNILDITPDSLLQAPLYTNQTQQGAASTRLQPPISFALCQWANCGWYGNTEQRHSLRMQILGVYDNVSASKAGLQQKDIVIIDGFAYQAASTVAIAGVQFDISTASTAIQRVNQTAKQLVDTINSNNGNRFFDAFTQTSPDAITGTVLTKQMSGNAKASFANWSLLGVQSFGLYRQDGWDGTSSTVYPCPLSPVPLVKNDVSTQVGKGFKITRIQSDGIQLIFTLDSAPDFAVGDTIHLGILPTYQDLSQAAGSQGGTDFTLTGGYYVVRSISGNDIKIQDAQGNQITLAAVFDYNLGFAPYTTVWNSLGALCCVRTQDGYTTFACGQNTRRYNRLFYSAFQEYECAPPLNYFDIGRNDSQIIQIYPLGESLFVFKEDGLYRVYGQYPNFGLDQFDKNIILAGPDLVCSMGGAIYAMTTRGAYRITQTQAQRISFDIQGQIDRILWGSPAQVARRGFAIGNQDDNSVTFWMPNYTLVDQEKNPSTVNNIAFVFDGQGWTTRDDKAVSACCGRDSNDQSSKYRMYVMKNYGSGWLTRERKQFDATDYADQSFLVPIGAVSSTSASGITMTVDDTAGAWTSQLLRDGCVIVPIRTSTGRQQWRARMVVTSATNLSGTLWSFTVQSITSYNQTIHTINVNGDLDGVKLFVPIVSVWQRGIQDSQDATIRKHYSQIGIIFQQPYFTKFQSVKFYSDVNPYPYALTGNVQGFISGYDGTQTNCITGWKIMDPQDEYLQQKAIRLLVPSTHARCSQLRFQLTHSRALEFVSDCGYFYRASAGGKNIERDNA